MSVLQPAWLPDPTGRHERRWWNGTAWTDAVVDQGVESVDLLGGFQPARPTAGFPPQPQPEPAGSGERELNRGLALVAGVAVVAVLAVGIVAVVANRRGDSDETDGTDPREALISADDLPAEWERAESPPGTAENVICEPGIEPADPPRQADAYFDRPGSPDWLFHAIIEYSPQVANDVLDDHERQAEQCGTFEDVNQIAGETQRATITPEVLTGPTLGDETLWYVLHIDNEAPGGGSFDLLTCLDRHGGVVSAVRVSTRLPISDADRALVEDLARTVSDRLET